MNVWGDVKVLGELVAGFFAALSFFMPPWSIVGRSISPRSKSASVGHGVIHADRCGPVGLDPWRSAAVKDQKRNGGNLYRLAALASARPAYSGISVAELVNWGRVRRRLLGALVHRTSFSQSFPFAPALFASLRRCGVIRDTDLSVAVSGQYWPKLDRRFRPDGKGCHRLLAYIGGRAVMVAGQK